MTRHTETVLGHALYLDKGLPVFAVRSGGQLAKAAGTAKIPDGWIHLAGVLTSDQKVLIYVNGTPVGSAKASGLVTADPQDGLEIGADDESSVGDCIGPAAFSDLIDEVRVYHRTLSREDVLALGAGNPLGGDTGSALVLGFTFDDGQATDLSGYINERRPGERKTRRNPGRSRHRR